VATNDQVFASKAERINYYKLSRQWGSPYRIYHNLPFLNLLNTKGLVNAKKLGNWHSLLDSNEPDTISIGDVDYNRLKKTSIDYTVCDENDRPLLCIEFDGIKDGFNVGTEYRFDGPPDPWRELITGLKLKVAHGSMFPYFVVGYEHFKDLSAGVQLTMVDGIIGEVLSSMETKEKIGEGFDPEEVGFSQEAFDDLPPDEQHEIIQDWLVGVEVDAEMRHNPVSRKVAELEREIGFLCACTMLWYPDLDEAKSPLERARMINGAVMKGCRCSLHDGMKIENGELVHHTCRFGPITATVWLPNFNTPHCSPTLGLVENMSKLIALDKARSALSGGGRRA
jgi:hypothetical protein